MQWQSGSKPSATLDHQWWTPDKRQRNAHDQFTSLVPGGSWAAPWQPGQQLSTKFYDCQIKQVWSYHLALKVKVEVFFSLGVKMTVHWRDSTAPFKFMLQQWAMQTISNTSSSTDFSDGRGIVWLALMPRSLLLAKCQASTGLASTRHQMLVGMIW